MLGAQSIEVRLLRWAPEAKFRFHLPARVLARLQGENTRAPPARTATYTTTSQHPARTTHADAPLESPSHRICRLAQGKLKPEQVEALQLLHGRVLHEVVAELPQLSNVHLLCTFARVPVVVKPRLG